METIISNIPVIKKSKMEKKVTEAAASCCTPKTNVDVCCTPSETKEANDGACCAQPDDGSVCCNK